MTCWERIRNLTRYEVLFYLVLTFGVVFVFSLFPSSRIYFLGFGITVIALCILTLFCVFRAEIKAVFHQVITNPISKCVHQGYILVWVRIFGPDCCAFEEPDKDTESPPEVVVKEGKMLCHLCHTQVPRAIWDCGDHRRDCASEHADRIDRMTNYTHKLCPMCDQSLRVWPGEGEKFYCNNNRMCRRSQGGAIINNGLTRFTCFPCDVNFCIDCIQNGPRGNSPTPPPQRTPDRGTSLDINMEDLEPEQENDPEPAPWIPSAPPDEDNQPHTHLPPSNGGADPPSYAEAVLTTSSQQNNAMPSAPPDPASTDHATSSQEEGSQETTTSRPATSPQEIGNYEATSTFQELGLVD